MMTERANLKWCKSLHKTRNLFKDMDDLEILEEWCTHLMGAYRRSCRFDETDTAFSTAADKMMERTAKMLNRRKR